MKNILKLYFIFGLVTLVEAASLYAPTPEEFYRALSNSSHDWIIYNTGGTYQYLEKQNIIGTGNLTLNILFIRDTSLQNIFVLENLNLSDYENIVIWIRHRVKIKLINCTFNFKKNGGMKIYFENDGYLYPQTLHDTGVTIDSCTFNNDYGEIGNEPAYQLMFTKDVYPDPDESSKNFTMQNVEIKNTEFYLFNYPEQLHNNLTAIQFYRPDADVSFSNIRIRNATIEFSLINDAITDGIVFSNNNKANFRKPDLKLYSKNRNIDITDNYLYSDSGDPGHAVFMQGPYDTVSVSSNKLYRFGANFLSDQKLHLDGSIHLYGARIGRYCDDIRNAVVSRNTVHAVSSAIQVLGAKDCLIEENKVSMLPYPAHWINDPRADSYDRMGIIAATGDYKDDSRQSENIVISNNLINCNNEDGSLGIMTDAKNFTISGNRINNPGSYGIIYWGHEEVSELDVGTSAIVDNSIDFGNEAKKDLKAYFYSPEKYRGMEFSGIHFYRMNNGEIYENEKLRIKNNHIINNDAIKDTLISDFNTKKIKTN